MAIGPFIRKKLGPLEKPISDAYRNFFMSMKDLTLKIKTKVPNANYILEVGSGEGAIINFLSDLYPDSKIVGIDIIEHVGRQFNKYSEKVSFQKIRIEDFIVNNSQLADMVYVGDVLHHIPKSEHITFLKNVKKSIKPNGYLCLKDIDRNGGFVSKLGEFADRYVTGDDVNYLSILEFNLLIKSVFGEDIKVDFDYIKPWKSNIIFYIQNH